MHFILRLLHDNLTPSDLDSSLNLSYMLASCEDVKAV